ncbi:hypothetical protein C8F04DRAFT_1085021 [Mycena alexandri]|uniref:MYND-type domain-containing protein n=1 Tax=Mycena alexandri TaxID=1745969 RepID=A0AAD6T7H8_9AGAR|nr:hypothetical protein C8F04DRAFT_1085021 [Mycena alexandri]
MLTGKDLLIQGERNYEAGRIPQAFELYRQAIIQIVDKEDVHQKILAVPAEAPQEIIAIAWQNLSACFRSDAGGFTQEAYPDAYNLVYTFRPTAHGHPQFKGPKGRRLLKAIQISAALTLGLLAWGKGDRSSAAKRYHEALTVAATHPPFNAVTPGLKHLDRTTAFEVQEIRDNLAMLMRNDSMTASSIGSGQGVLRKEVLNAPNARLGDVGGISHQETFVVATDGCGRVGCTNRGVGFKRCSACKKTAYCSVDCQKEDWKKHKLTHTS